MANPLYHMSDGSFHERKAVRTEHFWRYSYGWRQRACGACNGSGRYDHNGSPPCGACGGSGPERYRGPKSLALAAAGRPDV